MGNKKYLQITLIRSINGRLKNHVACLKGLGLRKMHQITTVEDTPSNRGMINKISYLLKIEEV